MPVEKQRTKMLSVSTKARAAMKQMFWLYLKIFAVCACVAGLIFIYLVFKYGPGRVVQAVSVEDAKSTMKWLLLLPLLGVGWAQVESLIRRVVGSR